MPADCAQGASIEGAEDDGSVVAGEINGWKTICGRGLLRLGECVFLSSAVTVPPTLTPLFTTILFEGAGPGEVGRALAGCGIRQGPKWQAA